MNITIKHLNKTITFINEYHKTMLERGDDEHKAWSSSYYNLLGLKLLFCNSHPQSESMLLIVQTAMDNLDSICLEVAEKLKTQQIALEVEKEAFSESSTNDDSLINKSVRVKKNQNSLGGDKYPGRFGVIQKKHPFDEPEPLYFVLLKPTNRAKERVDTFWLSELIFIDDENAGVTSTGSNLPAGPIEIPDHYDGGCASIYMDITIKSLNQPAVDSSIGVQQ